MKVLNYTGLQNLWTNIKNYITAHTPTKTSDLTNDSGFLTSTDISSKANDSEVLHKAQTETVTGEKTFKKDVKIIDLNANERPGIQFEVNGSFITFKDAKDALPDTDSGDFGGTLWSGWVLDDNTKIQNSMSDYVINDITFGTTNYSSVIELNNYYKVKYGEADNAQTDLRGMLRFELLPYAGIQKDSFGWSNPKLYFYAMLDNDEFGETILGHEDAHWSKAYINEINCYEIKFGGNSIHDILEHIVSLSYVTHYSSTALTSNSTNSLSIIDNQDSVKVNDKVIDSSGKMFYITSVDRRNSEFEVGSVVDTFAKGSAVSTAQATANSAQQTATTARQQSYVFRYSSTALVASSTNSNTLLDNTDNLKVGDKVIDSSGVLFSITAIDTQNSTFTIGTALIDLAKDSDVVHKSGNETITGTKTFLDVPIPFKSSTAELGVTGGNTKVIFTDKNLLNLAGITFGNYGSTKLSYCRFHIYDKDSNNQEVENFIEFSYVNNNQLAYFRPNKSNFVTLGAVNNRWSKVYADEYYYGSNNVEFSIKFVTTDTAQTISGVKTFTNDLLIYNSDTTAYASYLNLKNQKVARGSSETGSQGIQYQDRNNKTLTMLESRVISNGNTGFNIICYNIDGNNQIVSDGVSVIKTSTTTNFAPTTDKAVTCGRALAKWSDVQTYKVNGVEPSSLSLPSGNDSDKIDISSYITDLSGTPNSYTPPANGYLTFTFSNGSRVQIYTISGGGVSSNWVSGSSAGIIRGFMPVLKNSVLRIVINATTMDSFYFIPCQGNV